MMPICDYKMMQTIDKSCFTLGLLIRRFRVRVAAGALAINGACVAPSSSKAAGASPSREPCSLQNTIGPIGHIRLIFCSQFFALRLFSRGLRRPLQQQSCRSHPLSRAVLAITYYRSNRSYKTYILLPVLCSPLVFPRLASQYIT